MLITAVAGAVGNRIPAAPPPASKARLRYPFTLGVASGEPTSDGFVLWTRLATDPLAANGRGGMPDRDIEVEWQLAIDEKFAYVIHQGTVPARRADAHSVHLELAGLQPGREYFYRFRVDSHVSPAGRTQTAPAWNVFGPPLRMAVASCAHYEHGYFNGYRAIAADEPDVVVHLGDYIYEYAKHKQDFAVRDHEGGETRTLADYRRRHAQYKTDPDLQAAHAAAPWIMILDDHEVANDWADEIPQKPEAGFRARRAAAFRAYYENAPLRANARPRGPDMQLYRRLTWGQLARFHLLDTRQYRDDQPCGGRWATPSCEELDSPKREMLGATQERWLVDGIRSSPSAWNFLGQQIPMIVRDFDPGRSWKVPVDGWDGYPAARGRLLGQLASVGYKNPVVLTGDAHMHLAGDLHVHGDDPDSKRAAVELCATSISSEGDGVARTPDTDLLKSQNPALRYVDSRRGYLRVRVQPDSIDVDFRVVPYVSRRGAEAETSRSFTVEYGRPVLQRTSSGTNPV
ncbi:alkaline phosphatase PhoD [Flindersiella endophytica]